MEDRPTEQPRGNVKGVLAVLGICLALGAAISFLQGQWSGAPTNTPDCADDIVIHYDPQAPDAPASILLNSLHTVFEVPRDEVPEFDQQINQRIEKGGSFQIKYNEVICEHDVSELRLGEDGTQVLKFDVRSGMGSTEVKTRQGENGFWHMEIVAVPIGEPLR